MAQHCLSHYIKKIKKLIFFSLCRQDHCHFYVLNLSAIEFPNKIKFVLNFAPRVNKILCFLFQIFSPSCLRLGREKFRCNLSGKARYA